MHCKEISSRLNAYLDDELSARQRLEIEGHLDTCRACREQLEGISLVSGLLDNTLDLPLLPQGFAARVMVEARSRSLRVMKKKPSFVLDWSPLRWLAELSAPMRLATGAMVFLACLLGFLMSREVSLSGGYEATVTRSEDLDGFEWFNPTPPVSLGSAYLALASTSPENRGTQ